MTMMRVTFLVIVFAAAVANAGHWNYSHRDHHHGPSAWGEINKDCIKSHNSPININAANVRHRVKSIEFGPWLNRGYYGGRVTIQNNGHAFQVNIPKSSQKQIWVKGGAGLRGSGTYYLAQFHFHWGKRSVVGSEHTIEGKHAPLEMHMVMYNSKYGSLGNSLNKKDGVLVVAQMFTEYVGHASCSDSSWVDTLFRKYAPKVKLAGAKVPGPKRFPLDTFLSPTGGYYAYKGSFTTPNCNRVVSWYVARDRTPVSSAAMNALRRLLNDKSERISMDGNFRPVQRSHSSAVKMANIAPRNRNMVRTSRNRRCRKH